MSKMSKCRCGGKGDVFRDCAEFLIAKCLRCGFVGATHERSVAVLINRWNKEMSK